MPTLTEFLSSPRRSDAELASDINEVQRTSTRVEGQHAADAHVQEHREKVMLEEAVRFADTLRQRLPETNSQSDAERAAAYFASALFLLNLRANFPEAEGGPEACDELGRQAVTWLTSQGVELPARPSATPQVALDVFLHGAELTQRLLGVFPELVADAGIDRRQGCFAASLLTVRLRAGEVGLFVAAAAAATTYFVQNWEKA